MRRIKLIYAALFVFSNTALAIDVSVEELKNNSRGEIKTYLEKNTMSVEDWVLNLNSEPLDFLCLGEVHNDKYRKFYSGLIQKIKVDQLFLEAKKNEAQEIVKLSRETEDPVNYEGADIAPFIRAAFLAHPTIKVTGVEQSKEQSAIAFREETKLGRNGKKLSRESFVALNVLKNIKIPQRHVALYGAHHCSNYDQALPYTKPFSRLIKEARPALVAKSVYVLFRSDLSKFARSLMGFGFFEKSFVMADTSKIDISRLNYRADILKFMKNYDVIIYINDK